MEMKMEEGREIKLSTNMESIKIKQEGEIIKITITETYGQRDESRHASIQLKPSSLFQLLQHLTPFTESRQKPLVCPTI